MCKIDLPYNKFFKYKIKDCRTIYIDLKDVPFSIFQVGGEIQSINIGDLWYNLNIGDNFTVNIKDYQFFYKINHITQLSKTEFCLLTDERNRTSLFLVPILKVKHETRLTFNYDDYLVNGYLSEDLSKICLKYRFFPHKEYKELEYKLLNHPYFCGLSDLPNGYVKINFKIPEEFKEDVKLFIDGKYSELSTLLKNKIMLFHGFSYHNKNRVLSILNKSKWLKERWEEELDVFLDENMELESKPNLEFEVWQL